MCREQCGEYAYWCLGLQGYLPMPTVGLITKNESINLQIFPREEESKCLQLIKMQNLDEGVYLNFTADLDEGYKIHVLNS